MNGPVRTQKVAGDRFQYIPANVWVSVYCIFRQREHMAEDMSPLYRASIVYRASSWRGLSIYGMVQYFTWACLSQSHLWSTWPKNTEILRPLQEKQKATIFFVFLDKGSSLFQSAIVPLSTCAPVTPVNYLKRLPLRAPSGQKLLLPPVSLPAPAGFVSAFLTSFLTSSR